MPVMKVIKRRRRYELKWGCPPTRGLSNWCNAFCVPHGGIGDCGRPAPHALLGRTQLAIIAHRRRLEAAGAGEQAVAECAPPLRS